MIDLVYAPSISTLLRHGRGYDRKSVYVDTQQYPFKRNGKLCEMLRVLERIFPLLKAHSIVLQSRSEYFVTIL